MKESVVSSVPEANVELLDKVLTGLTTGKLEYEAKHWHSGTAHNIGGWVQVFYYRAQGYTYNPKSKTFIGEGVYFDPYDDYTYNDVMKILGLTPEETSIVASSLFTVDDALILLSLLKKNIRILGIYKESRFIDKPEYTLAYIKDNTLCYPPVPLTLRCLLTSLFLKYVK